MAALWYCLFDGPRRYRLDQDELSSLWADTIPENRRVPHQPAYCVAEEERGPVVFRLYPTQKSNAGQIVEEVRKKLESDAQGLRLRKWIERGEYGYAIAVPSIKQQRRVERQLAKLRSGAAAWPARPSRSCLPPLHRYLPRRLRTVATVATAGQSLRHYSPQSPLPGPVEVCLQ